MPSCENYTKKLYACAVNKAQLQHRKTLFEYPASAIRSGDYFAFLVEALKYYHRKTSLLARTKRNVLVICEEIKNLWEIFSRLLNYIGTNTLPV